MTPPLPLTSAAGRRRLSLLSLALAALAMLAINMAADSILKPFHLDLTEESLFTLSKGSRRVLASIDEPIIVRLYFSRRLGERSPPHASFYNRVKGLLLQYADLAGGRLKMELTDPEPFSEAEDRAVAFGLQGVPVTEGGELGYFGLAATNSVDAQEVVPFFNLEREIFLEYDLTRLIHSLTMTKRKTIGVLSTLPLDSVSNGLEGDALEMALQTGGGQRWLVMEQIRELFEVRTLPVALDALPPEIDVLMLVQPKGLSERTIYAIDQFVLKGGRVLVFVDPVAESDRRANDLPLDGSNRLLQAWGVHFVPDKVAANIDAARRVNAGHGIHTVLADYVAWLSLGRETFDNGDAVVGTLERIHMATAGVLEVINRAETTVHPVIMTSPRSMQLSTGQFTASLLPDVVGLARAFHSENQRLVLAVRITGLTASAFGNRPPGVTEKTEANAKDERHITKHLEVATQPVNLLVVADTDILSDNSWVQRQNFFGQQLVIPIADNGTFVLNALEDLSGAEALIGLRGRGRTDRPFTLVETLRREAESRYRAKEQALLQQIEAVQDRMRSLERREGKPAETLLTPEERKTLENFRRDLLTARRELRAVKHALAQDIEHLEGWLKAVNIAGVPLLLIGMAVGVAMRRRRLHHLS